MCILSSHMNDKSHHKLISRTHHLYKKLRICIYCILGILNNYSYVMWGYALILKCLEISKGSLSIKRKP